MRFERTESAVPPPPPGGRPLYDRPTAAPLDLDVPVLAEAAAGEEQQQRLEGDQQSGQQAEQAVAEAGVGETDALAVKPSGRGDRRQDRQQRLPASRRPAGSRGSSGRPTRRGRRRRPRSAPSETRCPDSALQPPAATMTIRAALTSRRTTTARRVARAAGCSRLGWTRMTSGVATSSQHTIGGGRRASCAAAVCGRGGIGRHAGLRSRWANALGGSSPFARIILICRAIAARAASLETAYDRCVPKSCSLGAYETATPAAQQRDRRGRAQRLSHRRTSGNRYRWAASPV